MKKVIILCFVFLLCAASSCSSKSYLNKVPPYAYAYSINCWSNPKYMDESRADELPFQSYMVLIEGEVSFSPYFVSKYCSPDLPESHHPIVILNNYNLPFSGDNATAKAMGLLNKPISDNRNIGIASMDQRIVVYDFSGTMRLVATKDHDYDHWELVSIEKLKPTKFNLFELPALNNNI